MIFLVAFAVVICLIVILCAFSVVIRAGEIGRYHQHAVAASQGERETFWGIVWHNYPAEALTSRTDDLRA
jgi:hypothetical protein